ncbi:MAG TPA: hypothetical protein VFV34_13960 [Blastocatellia bacterium]|nr:hypothetical protein [Blastocatellia bacterium]
MGQAGCTVQSRNGFGSPVILSAVGLPADAGSLFQPAIVTPPPNGSVQSNLMINVGRTQPGSYPFSVRGTSGGVDMTFNMQLDVRGPTTSPKTP